MSRFPLRSAMRPQIGAITAEMRKVTENASPAQRLTEESSTPSSMVRYIGRNGMIIV